MFRPWRFIKEKRNRDIVSWLGGSAIAVTVGIWTLLIYFFPHEYKRPPVSTTVITQSGAGIASGGNTIINAPVKVGLDAKQISRQLPRYVQSLVKLGEAGVRDEDISQRLDQSADELVRLRKEIARLKREPARLASYGQQAQALVDKGDFDGARTVVANVEHVHCTAGICNPDDGYIFINPRYPGDLSVRWDPGRASNRWPHVHSGDTEGFWTADDGFVFANPHSGDMAVAPIGSQKGSVEKDHE